MLSENSAVGSYLIFLTYIVYNLWLYLGEISNHISTEECGFTSLQRQSTPESVNDTTSKFTTPSGANGKVIIIYYHDTTFQHDTKSHSLIQKIRFVVYVIRNIFNNLSTLKICKARLLLLFVFTRWFSTLYDFHEVVKL